MYEDPARSLLELLPLTNEELAKVDPLVINLLVAKGILSLRHLDIEHYVKLRDRWVEEVRRTFRRNESKFHADPERWHDRLEFFRMLLLLEYMARDLGIRYREDQRFVEAIRYTDPSDLFLNGVMDTRQGTCGNISALFFSMAWKLGLSNIAMACQRCHHYCRYVDGDLIRNIHADAMGPRGVPVVTDKEMIEVERVSPMAIRSGSDMRSLTPQQTLGIFLGLRGRHFVDTGRVIDAEPDFLLARFLFPNHRRMYKFQVGNSLDYSLNLYEPGEEGHPLALMTILNSTLPNIAWSGMKSSIPTLENSHAEEPRLNAYAVKGCGVFVVGH